jgi:hypothetical protein
LKPEDVLVKLIKRYGIRRAVMLYGAASVAAARGWDVMIGDDAYSRQGVWTWKRDLEAVGVDPAAVEWSGFERKFSADMGEGLKLAKVKLRKKEAGKSARALRGRVAT